MFNAVLQFVLKSCIHVFQSGRPVLEDLSTDLRDGTHLLSLIEVLSGSQQV